ASVTADGYTLWLENGQLQTSRHGRPSDDEARLMQEWQQERAAQPAEQGQPDEYAIPVDDQDWPMLVQLCGDVYQAKGHAGAYHWIEMLPDPYRCEMWRVLEGLDTPEWL